MQADFDIDVPSQWTAFLETDPRGGILVIGGPDTGKSTFVRWLVRKLAERQRLAWIDCDVGQSTLGLPSTLNLGLVESPASLPSNPTRAFFVGSISPRGHMLPMVVGAERLRRTALDTGVDCLVTDTTGMIGTNTGGRALKQWKIELLQPDRIVGLERGRELDPILTPLEFASRPQVHRMKPSGAVRSRDRETREDHRRREYRRYFGTAARQRLSLQALPVYNNRRAEETVLVSLQDAAGFSLALGIVLKWESDAIELLTPLSDPAAVAGLRFGSLKVEPGTWKEDRRRS